MDQRHGRDRQRFALHLPSYGEHLFFFFLLPHGEPLHAKAIDAQLAVTSPDQIDWDAVAAPEQIARQAILNGARVMKDQSDFCMLEGPDHMLSNLAKVVALNLDQPFLADTVLEFWPACRDTDEMVVEHVKSGAATGDWQARLAQKIAALEAGPPLAIRELVTVVGACRALKDKALLHKAYALALERWPAEYDAHSAIFAIFRFHMESLPDDIKGRLVEKARRTLESGTEFQRGQAREILEEAR